MTGIAGVGLPYLEGQNKAFERKFVGALDFADQTIEAALKLHAGLYKPSFAQGPKRGQWDVSGILVSKDSFGASSRKSFLAVVESVCEDAADAKCWRMVNLTVDGQAVDTASVDASTAKTAMDAGTPADGPPDLGRSNEPDLAPALLTDDKSGVATIDALDATAPPDEHPVEATAAAPADAQSEATAQAPTSAGSDGAGSSNGLAMAQVSSQDLIRLIQDALARLSYDPGPIDGRVGAQTASAIKAFQRDYNLVPDGRPTLELLGHLQGKIDDLQQQTNAPASGGVQPSG